MMFRVPLKEFTVTVLSAALNPRSTWSGSQGVCSSSSPKQRVYLPGYPWEALSTSPGLGAADVQPH